MLIADQGEAQQFSRPFLSAQLPSRHPLPHNWLRFAECGLGNLPVQTGQRRVILFFAPSSCLCERYLRTRELLARREILLGANYLPEPFAFLELPWRPLRSTAEQAATDANLIRQHQSETKAQNAGSQRQPAKELLTSK